MSTRKQLAAGPGQCWAAALPPSVLAGAIALAAPASADEPVALSRVAAENPRICERLQRLVTRSTNAVTRLEAGPDARGSIAWLAARAQAATAAGDNDLAQLYSDRAVRRTETVALLQALGPDLAGAVGRHCG